MSKVTGKLQVTIPKALALRYGIRPGDEVAWEELLRGAVMIRVDPGGGKEGAGLVREGGALSGATALEARTAAGIPDAAERAARFDRFTRWIDAVLDGRPDPGAADEEERISRAKRERGWSREDLYGDRGFPRPR